ncbi:MAG: phosphatase PAP2 family protein [Gorillibacterium sp.]|nr:phosphatase PAP2 family protein [Gorillibacterium sp.]
MLVCASDGVAMKRFSKGVVKLLTWGWLMTLGCTLIFVILARGISKQIVFGFDSTVFELVRSVSSDRYTHLALAITNFGSLRFQLFCFIGVCLLYLWFNRVWEPVVLFICWSGVWGMNIALKTLFHRARPVLEPYITAGGYSFPSGHAMSSMAFFGMGSYLLWRLLRRRMKRAWLIPLVAGMVVLAVGWSRIYLGVHFSSDVLAGYAAGGLWLNICITGGTRLRRFKVLSL